MALILWARKAIECSKPAKLFCGNLEDKNIKEMQIVEPWLMKFQGEI